MAKVSTNLMKLRKLRDSRSSANSYKGNTKKITSSDNQIPGSQ